ncbi:MBL fold metallo-hydrolase [Streptomyces olivaceoviridis]|uniref:MBL fold metallo-hydrolase n=1 Tax=Streptomyces olivaceoviridis TaxID=1921 RepID=UPI0016770A76|nr:MBL fold metallo-hydrolase [Streptomyces olivaceoviridis]
MRGAARVERVVTSGTFSLDGGTFHVDTDVWLVGGDDEEVLVLDAAHDAEAIHRATTGRRVTAIVCTHAPFLNAVFTGDTLVHGGPGATGRSYSDRSHSDRSYSDRPAIEAPIRARLLPLPGDTVVHTGHGRDTTIAAERPSVHTA